MTCGQPGWNEYIAIRNERKASKMHDTLALQKRHGQERAALGARLQTQRTDALSGNWKNQGAKRNELQSQLALVQATEKLELSAQHKAERQALQARYKPLAMYRQWKDQPQIVGLHIVPVIERSPVAGTSLVASTLRALTSTVDARQHITYQLCQKNVFRDEGRTIAILDLASDAGIAAALAIAQQKFGNVLTVTGPLAFQHNAVAVAVANGLSCKFADPVLDALRKRLQDEKYQAERQARQTGAERVAPVQQVPLTRVPVLEVPPALLDLAALAEAGRLRQEEKADAEKFTRAEAAKAHKVVDAQKAAEEHRLSEPAQLEDIERQVAQAKAEAGAGSALHSRPVVQAVEEDYARAVSGASLGSNATFVAVSIGREIKVYRVQALARQHVEYDGLGQGFERFAKGNLVEIRQERAGTRITVSEQREAMQDKAQRKPGQGLGR